MSGKRRKLNQLKVRWNPKTKKMELVLLEEHVLQEIVDRLWLKAKIRMIRINQPVGGVVRQNEAGIPDLMGWIPQTVEVYTGSVYKKWAVPLFIEVKRPGGVRSPAQIRFIEDAKKDGCIAFFAESWIDVMRELYDYLKLSA